MKNPWNYECYLLVIVVADVFHILYPSQAIFAFQMVGAPRGGQEGGAGWLHKSHPEVQRVVP